VLSVPILTVVARGEETWCLLQIEKKPAASGKTGGR
jgi:hypothetical protein